MYLKVWPMMFYNIVSISVFFILMNVLVKSNAFIKMYFVACSEVVVHQVLAAFFLGSFPAFHYFILLMGLLPFLIFDKKVCNPVLVSIPLIIVFILYENVTIVPHIQLSYTTLKVMRYLNMSITIYMILLMIYVFTNIVRNVEKNLTKQNQSLEREINLASVIQQNFFKQDLSQVKGWDIAYYSKPMVGVSGDLFDVYKKDGFLRGLGIFDVSGHGISSGLVTMLVKNIIFQEFYKENDEDLWEVMNRINDRVIEEKGDIENYLTGILLRIQEKTIEMVCASHPSPLLYRKSENTTSYIPQDKNARGAIGIQAFPAYYVSQYFDFEKGDTLILYSDGVIDVKNKTGETFGKERLKRIVEFTNHLDAQAQIEQISIALDQFRGNARPSDDVSIIVLKK